MADQECFDHLKESYQMLFFKCGCLVLLLILLIPIQCLAAETGYSFANVDETYVTATEIFARGAEEHQSARALFDSIRYYKDSAQYINYIDALAALAANDFDPALIAFRMLGIVHFLDADLLYTYTCARRAEQIGDYFSAIDLYAQLTIRDSEQRLLSLRKYVFQMDNPDDELPPSNARLGGYAYVMAEGVGAVDTPDATEPFAILPFYQLIHINGFSYDAQGRLYVQTTIDSQSSLTRMHQPQNGYIPAYFLHFLSDDEMLTLELAYHTPLIGNGLTWLGTVAKRNTAINEQPGQSASLGQVNVGDTLLIVDEVTGSNGDTYYRVKTGDGEAYGYVLADRFEGSPVPGPTPAPLPRPEPPRRSVPGNVSTPATPEQIYALALRYALDGSESALERAMQLFLLHREYENSAFYADYMGILLCIERGEFDQAREALLALEETGYFWCRKANLYRGIMPNEPVEIADPETITKYLQAREMESAGLSSGAYALYEGLGNYLDSIERGIQAGAADAAALENPKLFMSSFSQSDNIPAEFKQWPLRPIVIYEISSNKNSSDLKELFLMREGIMKRSPRVREEGFLSLPEGITMMAHDAYRTPKDIETLIIDKFMKMLSAHYKDRKIIQSNSVFFDQIALEKVLSVDISKDLKRWNVCVVLKMTEPQTGDIVFMPLQMSSDGSLSSSYFDSVSRSVNAFVQEYALLLSAGFIAMTE